jgi:hypothetical protein
MERANLNDGVVMLEYREEYITYIIDNPRTVSYYIRKHFKPDDELFKMFATKNK